MKRLLVNLARTGEVSPDGSGERRSGEAAGADGGGVECVGPFGRHEGAELGVHSGLLGVGWAANVMSSLNCDAAAGIGQTVPVAQPHPLPRAEGALVRQELNAGASAPADSGEASERVAAETSAAETFWG